jgi:hypothetical protein
MDPLYLCKTLNRETYMLFDYSIPIKQKTEDFAWLMYRENAGLLALTRVGSRRVVQISAGFMIFFSILGKLLIHEMFSAI